MRIGEQSNLDPSDVLLKASLLQYSKEKLTRRRLIVCDVSTVSSLSKFGPLLTVLKRFNANF